MSARSHIREGFHTVTPYLIVAGAARLLEFVARAFDAEEVLQMPAKDGTIQHAEVRIGDSIIELADGGGEWQPMPAVLHMYVPDADAVYRRALEAGATSLREPRDEEYGERSAGVKDPSGNHWWIATMKR
jgi:uncharacterized glyoxalase superfamily protein PhnB